MFANNLVEQWVFVDRSTRATAGRMTLLFIGAATASCLLDPFRDIRSVHVGLGDFTVIVAVALFLAATCAVSCLAVAAKAADDGVRAVHRTALGVWITVATAMILELTHLLART